MGKKGLLGLSVFLILFLSGAESYTVILKNGKTLEGTLLSETSSMIVFKDAAGLQLSLKKSSLDLDKMNHLNAVTSDPTPIPVPVQTSTPVAPVVVPKKASKEAKVFTNADVPGANVTNPEEPVANAEAPVTNPEGATPASPVAAPAETVSPEAAVVEPAVPTVPTPPVSPVKREGKVFTNEAPAPPTPEVPISEPAPSQPSQTAPAITGDSLSYNTELKEGATQLAKTLQDLSALTDGIAVNWEVAASTGNDSKRSVKDYMSGATANAILGNVSRQLDSLQALQRKLSTPPVGMEQSFQVFSRSVDSLKSFQSQILQYESLQNMNLLKARLSELSGQIDGAMGVLQTERQKPISTPGGKSSSSSPHIA